MEKRKIQKTGGASYIITLPKTWLTRHKLKEKSIVRTIERSSGALLIRPEISPIQLKRYTVQADDFSPSALARELVSLYVTGAAEFTVRSKNFSKESRQQIRSILQRLIGFEIIEESTTSMKAVSILEPNTKLFRQSTKHMFAMAADMLEDAFRAVMTDDARISEDVSERDYEVDRHQHSIQRLYYLIIQDRLTDEAAQVEPHEALYYTVISDQLERIADHAVKIADIVSGSDREKLVLPKTKQFDTLVQLLPQLIKQAAEVSRLRKSKEAHNFMEEIEAALKHVAALRRSVAGKATVFDAIIIDSLDRILGYLSNLAERTVNTATITK